MYKFDVSKFLVNANAAIISMLLKRVSDIKNCLK